MSTWKTVLIRTSSGCMTWCKNLTKYLKIHLSCSSFKTLGIWLVKTKIRHAWECLNRINWKDKIDLIPPRMFIHVQKKLSLAFSWDIGASKLVQFNWPKAFWAITQNRERGIKNYKIFYLRLVLRNSKDKNISETLGNHNLRHFFSKH